ncbi:hypothetical protein AB1Y20_007391 [Prymnesium parvum]|uniref:Uncharacterized protein n=1 Tax=Prymnesium parvum TaxID=97485 RepID=A0AB34IUV2_PRYPA
MLLSAVSLVCAPPIVGSARSNGAAHPGVVHHAALQSRVLRLLPREPCRRPRGGAMFMAFAETPQPRVGEQRLSSEGAAQRASFGEAQSIGAELAARLSESCATGAPMPQEAVAVLKALLSHTAGARGWFVSLLTNPTFEHIFEPPLHNALLEAIEASPKTNIRLVVMNVAMPTATELIHLDNGNSELADASRMTRDRASKLLVALLQRKMPGLEEEIKSLLRALQFEAARQDGISDGSEADSMLSDVDKQWLKFARNWEYEENQRAAIHQQLVQVLTASGSSD